MSELSPLQKIGTIATIKKGALVAGLVAAVGLSANLLGMGTSLLDRASASSAEATALKLQLQQAQAGIEKLERKTDENVKNSDAIKVLQSELVEIKSAVAASKVETLNGIQEVDFSKIKSEISKMTSANLIESKKEIATELNIAKLELNKKTDEAIAKIGNANSSVLDVRTLNVIKKECIRIDGYGDNFTLKLKDQSEFCNQDGLLYSTMTISGSVLSFEVVGDTRFSCLTYEKCNFGSINGPYFYEMRIEKIYSTDGDEFVDVQFRKVS